MGGYEPEGASSHEIDFGTGAIQTAKDQLRASAGSAFDGVLTDLDDAFKNFQTEIKALKALGPGVQAQQINELSANMKDWLVTRNTKWTEAGNTLGKVLKSGISKAIGI